ncbi:NAD(P)H-hydrate dehydratase [Candidatus Peregrinibacteria bacterium]|nr:NAD(P)H-hydrate dehydratase [Candidatus Peregrinibacteria bacterium]
MGLSILKKGYIKKVFPVRNSDSHKGENGKVLIVGGSIEYYGAPLLSALGALYSGADLIYIFVPESNFDVARSLYPDFIVKKFPGQYLTHTGVKDIVDFSKECDAVLIGPGMYEREVTVRAILELVEGINKPMVLDSTAIEVLKLVKEVPLPQPIVVCPHKNEFEHLTDRDIKELKNDEDLNKLIRTIASEMKINIVLKSPTDIIASHEGDIVLNKTGNAGLTVGGTGDVLAGVITSLIAQKAEPFVASQIGAFLVGYTGDFLYKQKDYCFSATDVALELPFIIKNILQ